MSNYIEFGDTVAFHPGYYIQEIVEDSGLTQADFAKRLGTTPKNLSLLIRGEQSLSIDIAMKLSRLIGTGVSYWLNLQNAFDSLVAEFKSQEELVKEREIFEDLDYMYFRDNFELLDVPKEVDHQIGILRRFLKIASLTVLKDRDMTVNLRNAEDELTDSNIVKANAMVQIAINKALEVEAPKYDKAKFKRLLRYVLSLTQEYDSFYPALRDAFMDVGVVFILLPDLSGAGVNGAAKKVGNHVMLMLNDSHLRSDTFWFRLFHEIGHIIDGNYGISFENETGEKETAANAFAENALIPQEKYEGFKQKGSFGVVDIKEFAAEINRDAGIVLGRLQRDGLVAYDDRKLQSLRRVYRMMN